MSKPWMNVDPKPAYDCLDGSRSRWFGAMTAVGALAFQMSAFSAPDATDSNTQLESITVTARKIAENLQTVPISITAFSAADLNAAGVQDLRDLTFLTPGLTFNEGAGANYYSKPIIRGQTDIGGGPDNNVPVFFDGIYLSNSSAIDLGLIDLDRIEVIKGPVSATYGRSAYAGAIDYISAKPGDEMHGYAEGTVGDYSKANVRAAISGPLIDGILKGGISASYDKFDGTYHDKVSDQDANGFKKQDILANLDLTPNEHLEIRPVVYYGDDVFDSAAAIFAPPNCSVGLGYGYSQSFCGKVPDGTFEGPHNYSGGQYGQTGNTRHVFLSSLQAGVSYDWGTVTSLTGYDTYHTNEYADFDNNNVGQPYATYTLPAGASVGGFATGANAASPTLGGVATGKTVLAPLHFGYLDTNRDFSEELRFTSAQNQAFRWTVGGYYAKSYHYNQLNLALGTCGVPAGEFIISYFATPCGTQFSGQETVYDQNNRIKAAFAGADWDLFEKLTASTEIRYTETGSSYNDLSAIFTPFPSLGYSTSSASSPYPIGPGSLDKTFYSVTSRSSLKYQFTPDMQVYLSAANGEKAGGFNNNTIYQSYLPETNWTYELGVKSTFLDRRLLVNADMFEIEAKNYQIYGPPPGATLPGGFITTNYGGLNTKGLELEAQYIVVQGTKLGVGLAYVDPKFTSNAYDFGDVTLCSGIPSCAGRITKVGPNEAVSLNGLHPPYESNVTFNAALDLKYKAFADWDWFGRVDYRYESKQYYQYPLDTGWFGPKNIVNLRTGLEEGPLTLTLWVRNLTNDKTPLTVQDSALTGASNFQAGYYPVAVLPDGITFGATARYKF